MAKHRPHAKAKHSHSPAHPHAAKKPKADILSLPASHMAAFTPLPKNSMFSMLAWPMQAFSAMLKPWDFIPASSWMENWLANAKSLFPKAETSETEKEYIYQFALPGVAREQLALNFDNGMIMLKVNSAERQKGKRYTRSLRRAFSLPVYTDSSVIKATLKDGMLSIVIPKTDKPVSHKTHTIDVK